MTAFRLLRSLCLLCLTSALVAGCAGSEAPTATPMAATSTAEQQSASPTNAAGQAPTGRMTPTEAAHASAGTATPAALSGTLKFLVFGEPAESKAFFDVADGFMKANPGVKIETTSVPSQPDHLVKLATSLAAGDPPDVWVVDYRRFGLLQNSGVIQPAEKYINESTVIHKSDFYAKALDPFTVNGVLQCVPMNLSSLEVYYNKDLFDRAHVPYPQDGWTWADFVNDAVAITKLSTPDEKIYGVGIDPQLIRLAPFVWQNGGDIVDNQDHPTHLTLDTPAAKEAFQWFVDLQVKYHVVASQIENASEQDETRFMFNTLGMWLLSRRVVPALRTSSGFTWDVAPLPVGKQKASILHTDGYCMAKQSTKHALAWKFVEYANGPEGEAIAVKTGRTVPSLKAIANSPAYLQSDKPPASGKIFLDMEPYLRMTPKIGTWPDIELRANAAIEQAFYGNITVDQAIQEMETGTEAAFKGEHYPSSIVIPTPVPGRPGEDD